MASRALGAFFALAAAAAFVVSIASSAFWAGYPVVDGKQITAKHVRIGPLGATGCNIGGDGSCESLTIAQEVQLAGYAALGASALATLFAVLVLFAAAKVSERRRGIALASMLFALLAAGGAGAMIAIGPGLQASNHVEVPIAWGIYVFGGGVLASLIASLVTRKLEPEPLRLKPSAADIQVARTKRRKTPQPPPELQAYMEAQARQSQSQLQAPPHRQSQSQLPERAHRQSRPELQPQLQPQTHRQSQPELQQQAHAQQPTWQPEPQQQAHARQPAWQQQPQPQPSMQPSAPREPVNPFAQTVSPIAQVNPFAQTVSPFDESALPDSDFPAARDAAAHDPLMRANLPGMPPVRNGAPIAAGSGTMRARELGSPRAIESGPTREHESGSMRGNKSGAIRAKAPTAPPRSTSTASPPPATSAPRPASRTNPPAATNAPSAASTTSVPARSSTTTKPPLFGASPTGAPSRAKSTSAPPPLATNPPGAPGRANPTSAAPPHATNPTSAPRPASTTKPPPATIASRPASKTNPPPATNAPSAATTTGLPPRSSTTTKPPPFGASPTGAPGRAKSTSAPPPGATNPTGAPGRAKSTSAPPPGATNPTGAPGRAKSTSAPPPLATNPPGAPGRAKPASAPPPLSARPFGAPPSAKPIGAAAFAPKPIAGLGNEGARIKPPSVVPPLAKPAAAPGGKLPSITSPPKKPIVPLPAARAKTTLDDVSPGGEIASEPRASTETGIPPAPQPGAVRASRPNMTPVPTRSPTVAHVVPPMPTTGSQPAIERAEDEGDDTNAEPRGRARGIADDDASAEFSGRARSIGDNDARAGIQAAFGAAPVVDDTDASREVDDTDASREVDDIAHDARKRRSDTDMATGQTSTVGDVTQTGLEAPMPARAKIDVALRAAINLRLPDVEPEPTALSESPAPPVVDDLMKTMQDPQTPIPTLDRKAIPVLESGDPPERSAKVPLSTAPATLPPPKQLDDEPSGPSPACPQCESPMGWVDEHLRFYCRACRMYF